MDVGKHVDYWRTGSSEDFAAAESLLEKGHLRHSLFLAHLAIEKMLKAHVTRRTKDVPPRIHNLVRLAEMAGLELEPAHDRFLREFNVYQLEGRYPDSQQVRLDQSAANKEISEAGDMLEWLSKQL